MAYSVFGATPHPGLNALAHLCDEIVGHDPQGSLFHFTANSFGDVASLIVPPRMHFQVIAGSDGAEIEMRLIFKPFEYYGPAIKTRIIPAARSIEEK